MLILRSVLFYIGLSVFIIFYLPLMLLLAPLATSTRSALAMTFGKAVTWWLGITCRLHYRVEGREHLPTQPAVILAKHQSAWETIAFQRIFPPQTWVLKRELLWIPFFGWGLALAKPIAIDRDAGKKALRQVIEQGKGRLAEGLWVLIFPEGTRMPPGVRGRYASGGGLLAVKAGVPVVPVAHNAGTYWPKSGFIKYPGTITVRIGPTIDPGGKTAAQVTAEAEAWIEKEMAGLEALPSNALPPARENRV